MSGRGARRRFLGRVEFGRNRVRACAGPDFARPLWREGCWVFFSGHLADPADLARTLGGAATDSAELMARAYRRWGDAIQAHVLGEYSLVLWDPDARKLILTQDAVGLGGLFHRHDRDGVTFATHFRDLLDLSAETAIDPGYVAGFLANGQALDARTPLTHVKRLLPGRTIVAGQDGMHDRITWDPSALPVLRPGPEDAEAMFRDLLKNAVRASVNPDGQTWIALSGGLDSATIASVAGDLGLESVGAYSFVAGDAPGGDERAWAEAVIEAYPMPWHTIDAASAMPFSDLPRPELFQGEPSSAVIDGTGNRMLVDLLRDHDVRSVLTGHGGDLLLGAMPGNRPSHLVDLVWAGRLAAAARGVGAWSRSAHAPRSAAFLWRHAVLSPGLSHLRGHRFAADEMRDLPDWISPDYARAADLRGLGRRAPALPRDRFPGRQEIRDSIWALALSGNAAPFEGRHDTRRPFLHRPFLEFMLSVPGTERYTPRCDRWLQRRALKGILPEAVRRRGGKFFGTWPLVAGLARSPDWVDYLTETPQLVAHGITTAPAWRTALERACVGHTQGDRYFLTAIILEVWLKQMAARTAPRPDLRTIAEGADAPAPARVSA
ncbi:MAG: asparagine synthase-related protein [Pseudomonadota bacterium]